MTQGFERLLRAVARERAGIIAGGCALAGAFALKLFYAHAGATQLLFVLAPSCWLASHVFGVALAFEPAQGFVSHEAHLIVGPACAGMNFLVVCWLALYFTRERALTTMRSKLSCWLACLLIAYLATAVANGTRIALAAQLGEADIYGGLVTHERVHRLLGVVVYCAILLGVCSALGRRASYLVPLACYVTVALGLPLCRRLFGADVPGLFEHVTQTAAAAAAVTLAVWLCHRLLDRLFSRRESRWVSRGF